MVRGRPGGTRTRATLASAAASIALFAAVVPADAARIVRFVGEVMDGRDTPFELTAEFRKGNPETLRSYRTGRLLLTCDIGSQLRRTRRGGSMPLTDDGSFHSTTHHVVPPDGDIVRIDRVQGRIRPGKASGFVRVQTFDHPIKGDCDTGRLDWKADRKSEKAY